MSLNHNLLFCETGNNEIKDKVINMKFFDEETTECVKAIPKDVKYYITFFLIEKKRIEIVNKHRRKLKNIKKLKKKFFVSETKRLRRELRENITRDIKYDSIKSRLELSNELSDYKQEICKMIK